MLEDRVINFFKYLFGKILYKKGKQMEDFNKIYSEFLLGNVTFHRKEEADLFSGALFFYYDEKYVAAANLCATLYERIFTTYLIHNTSKPEGFIPSKDNLKEQLDNLSKASNKVTEGKGKLSFRAITEKLVDLDLVTKDEKQEYDVFYNDVRNPVAHGLSYRIFKDVFGREPEHIYEVDLKAEEIYKKPAYMLIEKIYHLMTVKVLRNR